MKLTGDDLRRAGLEALKGAGINRVDFAALIPGISQSAVFKFFDGTLETPLVEEQIREGLALLERTGGGAAKPPVISIEQGRASRRRRPGIKQRPVYDLVSTRKIATSIDFAVDNQAIVLITAEYGVGKTRGVDIWRAANPDLPSVVIEFDGFTSSAKFNFIARLADALGMGEAVGSTNQAGRAFARIIERLREEPTVLIFDQCETVRVEVLQLVRQIWDKTHEYGVAVVLLSGPPLYERLRLRKVQALGALTSRISAWPRIPGPGRDEVAGILAAEGYVIEGAGTPAAKDGRAVTEAAFETWYRAVGGSMRLLLGSIDVMAKAKGNRLGQRVVGEALDTLTGTRFDAPAPAWRGRVEEEASEEAM